MALDTVDKVRAKDNLVSTSLSIDTIEESTHVTLQGTGMSTV